MALGMPGVAPQNPDGSINAPGQDTATDNLNDLLGELRACIGAPYRFWNDGGNGMDTNSAAEVKARGESCTGIFVYAFRKIGIDPPFQGTYDAEQTLRQGNGETFDPGKTYPVGTFIVGVAPGTEGHLMMVSGPDNVVFESSVTSGVNEGKSARDVANPGYNIDQAVAGTFPEVGGSAGRGPLPGAGDLMGNIAEGVAQGVAKAFVRIFRILYALVILWPLDFGGGFWWELTKRVAGYWAEATQKIDLLKILKGEDTGADALRDLPAPKRGDLFSEENRNRWYFLIFGILSYILAFGFDRNNSSHLDNMINGGDRIGLGINAGEKGYNEEAAITATVSRRSGQGRNVDSGADNGAGSRRLNGRGNRERDARGKFTGRKNTQNPERQGDNSGGRQTFRGKRPEEK